MKKYFISLIVICFTNFTYTQNNRGDSTVQLLTNTRQDSGIVILLSHLSDYYLETKPDTAMILAEKGFAIAKKINYLKGEADLLIKIADAYVIAGNYPNALETNIKALDIFKNIKNQEQIASCLHHIALLYKDLKQYRQSLSFFF